MENITFHLDSFDGPLDLLLHLIAKNKVSIYDIPISQILEQYLDVLNQAKSMNLEIASEFIAMASELVLIKSKMLLPRHNTEEDEQAEDPRAKLALMLLEYQKIKLATPFLAKQAKFGENMYIKPPEQLSYKMEYEHTTKDLIRAARQLLRRAERKIPPSIRAFSGIVGRENVPISAMIDRILQFFSIKSHLSFNELFDYTQSRSEVVATFLAVLELSKTHRVLIDGTQDNSYITLVSPNGEED